MGDRRKRIWSELLDELNHFSDDELAAQLFGAKRINRAREHYGNFTAATDDRHFGKEAAEEISDLVAYFGMQLVAREARRQERIECFVADAVGEGLDELVANTETPRG